MKVLSYKDSGYERFVRKLRRRAMPDTGVRDLVAGIIEDVARHGDQALIKLTKRFDKASLTSKTLLVSEAEFEAAQQQLEVFYRIAARQSRVSLAEYLR